MAEPEKKTGVDGINALADEIGAAGARADLEHSAFKGVLNEFVTGMRDTVTMLKGMAAPPPAEEDDPNAADTPPPAPPRKAKPGTAPPQGQAPGGGGPGTPAPRKKPDEPDDAGYPDSMTLGTDGADQFLNVEPLIKRMDAHLSANEGKSVIAENTREIRKLRKAVEAQNSLFARLLETQIATTAPLMKGMVALREDLGKIPGPSPMQGRIPRGALERFGGRAPDAAPPVVTGKLAGKNPGELKMVLAKAVQARVIDDADVAIFQQTGRFDVDEATNTRVLSQVEALA